MPSSNLQIKKRICICNKTNRNGSLYAISMIYEFYALGFGDPIPISSSHGIGTGNLLDQIIENLPKRTEEVKDDAIKFCLIGRPNVGKSSLTNCLLNDNRVIN